VSPPPGLTLLYLLAAVLFIVGLSQLSSPRHARRGNLIAAVGMALALGTTVPLLHPSGLTLGLIALGIVVGAPVGALAARAVRMTAMPQMVASFNGVGGGAAALVGAAEYLRAPVGGAALALSLPVVFSVVIGAVSFSGSGIAYAKLQELMRGTPITYAGQQAVNGAVAVAIVVLSVLLVVSGVGGAALLALLLLALLLGVAFVLPIGGADMPVVISLLNAFTGLAVAGDGFVVGSPVLIVGGTLVGASGTFLTKMMSDAMGRSLGNILFGAFGQVVATVGATAGPEGRSVRAGGAEDIGTLLAYAQRVIIVPGYGLAVAQAQHAARELADALERRGVTVDYAIHPVAGRMPGHMNVLLAEANVPYEQLKEMDVINDSFKNTDVALVVGANDVVNPAARSTPGSPIFGMPILDVDQAHAIVFLKRSMRPGFAGIDNELLYDPKTVLMFGDAKDSLTKLVAVVKAA